MNAGTAILLGLGVVTVGGLGIYFATRSSSSSAPTPQPQPQTPDNAPGPTADQAARQLASNIACQNANQLAAIAKGSANPENERRSYDYWADQCRQYGGNPDPFPA